MGTSVGPSHRPSVGQQVQSEQVTRLLGLINRVWCGEFLVLIRVLEFDSCLALIDLLDSGRFLG